jgi:hypothetical protein
MTNYNRIYLTFVLILTAGVQFAFPINVISDLELTHPQPINSIEQFDSLYCSDGPIIVYENDRINSYGVRTNDNGFSVYKKSISSSADLICYIDETLQSFSFKLKDNIKTEKSVYEMPDKMFIISDIEGNFKGFQSILIGAGVIDAGFKWTFGSGHLVFVGDMFDRSPNVTECLWLLYKLESEAEMQGGKIHFILGNHEVMNMKKDFRYVRQKYFINADSLKLDYSKWYAANTELGRWLRSKNCIEKIGDIVFVHGGISKDFPYAEKSLDEINDSFRSRLDMELTKEENRKDIFIGRDSPIWYRGIADGKMEQSELDNILIAFGAKKMVIGHTIFDEIKYLYDGKVIAVDLEHRQNTEKGFMNGLIYENNEFYVVDNNGLRIILDK